MCQVNAAIEYPTNLAIIHDRHRNRSRGRTRLSNALNNARKGCTSAGTGNGAGADPDTITTQHQPYPTCISAGYGAKYCDEWEDDTYVSTTIKDYDGKDVSIMKTADPVTVYHTKKTITHFATGKYNEYANPIGGYAAPTGSAYKNRTDGRWYELYEKIEERRFSNPFFM